MLEKTGSCKPTETMKTFTLVFLAMETNDMN